MPHSLLARFGDRLPYYAASRNEFDPVPIVNRYVGHLGGEGRALADMNVLEIGVGATNSTAYEMAARGARRVLAFEPRAPFSLATDRALRRRIATAHGLDEDRLAEKVQRVTSLERIGSGDADLILSNSVLEHVSDPDSLFGLLVRVLSPGGLMLHMVDYRDHFFKHPYHLLRFSKPTWNRYLNPGDLPGWRLYDHIRQFEASGCDVEVLEELHDADAFAKIASEVSADYDRDDPRISAGICVLRVVRRPTQ
jgi:SAM-dependent methyltransferase